MLKFQDTLLRMPGLKQYFVYCSEEDREKLKVIQNRKIIFMIQKQYSFVIIICTFTESTNTYQVTNESMKELTLIEDLLCITHCSKYSVWIE